MQFLKIHKVASSANDTNIISYINIDHMSTFITAATTVTLYIRGLDADGLMEDTIVITTDGIASTKLVADGLASLIEGPYNSKNVRTIGAGFNGAAITTITAVTAA